MPFGAILQRPNNSIQFNSIRLLGITVLQYIHIKLYIHIKQKEKVQLFS